MEHHGFCASSDCTPGLRPLSKAEIWQLDCHVRCPEYLETASGVALASSCLVPAIWATIKPGASRYTRFWFPAWTARRRHSRPERIAHLLQCLHLDIRRLLFLLGDARVYSALRPRHFSSLYCPRTHWRSQSRFSSRLRRRLKHVGCPFHGDVLPVELGCLARTLARNFLDLRSGREPPKHCTL